MPYFPPNKGGSGGGAVSSVNSKTGTVVLNAEDVNALPVNSEFNNVISASQSGIDSATMVSMATAGASITAMDTNTATYAQKVMASYFTPQGVQFSHSFAEPETFSGSVTRSIGVIGAKIKAGNTNQVATADNDPYIDEDPSSIVTNARLEERLAEGGGSGVSADVDALTLLVEDLTTRLEALEAPPE